MKQYLETLEQIQTKGNLKLPARVNMPTTIQQFGKMMQIDLADGFPLYTSKKLSFSNIMHELNWFIKGHTSVKYLEYHKCRVWHDDSYAYYKNFAEPLLETINTFKACASYVGSEVQKYSRRVLSALFTPVDNTFEHRIFTKAEYKTILKSWGDEQRLNNLTSFELDTIIVEKTVHGYDRDEMTKMLSYLLCSDDVTYDFGDCGAQYGYLWRNLLTVDRKHNINRVDQFAELVSGLRTNPYGRRHIINSWNVGTLNDMALNACHPIVQFDVTNKDGKDYLSCAFFMRSNDMFLGNPYNIAFYATLTNVLAGTMDFEVGTLTWFGGDTHIYADHVKQVKEILKRGHKDLPKFDYKALSKYTISSVVSSSHTTVGIDITEGFVTNSYGENIYNGFDDEFQKTILSLLSDYNPHPAIAANLSTGN